MINKSGFTVLEVLIALAVLSIVMGAFVYQLQDHARMNWQVNKKVTGGWWLHKKLNEMQLDFIQPIVGVSEEEVVVDHNRWLYRSDITPTSHPNLFRVTLSLQEPEGVSGHHIKGYVLYGQ